MQMLHHFLFIVSVIVNFHAEILSGQMCDEANYIYIVLNLFLQLCLLKYLIKFLHKRN